MAVSLKDPVLSSNILQEMSSEGVMKNRGTFRILMDLYIETGDVPAAFQYYQDMITKFQRLDYKEFTLIFKANRILMLKEMNEKNISRDSPVEFDKNTSKSIALLFKLLNDMLNMQVKPVESITSLIDDMFAIGHVGQKEREEVGSILRESKKKFLDAVKNLEIDKKRRYSIDPNVEVISRSGSKDDGDIYEIDDFE